MILLCSGFPIECPLTFYPENFMKKFFTLFLIALFSFGLTIGEASAKRLGGGKSFGKQRQSVSQQRRAQDARSRPRRTPRAGQARQQMARPPGRPGRRRSAGFPVHGARFRRHQNDGHPDDAWHRRRRVLHFPRPAPQQRTASRTAQRRHAIQQLQRPPDCSNPWQRQQHP